MAAPLAFKRVGLSVIKVGKWAFHLHTCVTNNLSLQFSAVVRNFLALYETLLRPEGQSKAVKTAHLRPRSDLTPQKDKT